MLLLEHFTDSIMNQKKVFWDAEFEEACICIKEQRVCKG